MGEAVNRLMDKYLERGKRIAELQATIELTEELHKAILDLEGSDVMTDAKFAQWVLLALGDKV